MPDRPHGSWTFDQRQRYAFLREAAGALNLGRPCRLLDVGGAAPDRDGSLGWLPAKEIFRESAAPSRAEAVVVVLDRPAFSAPGYIRGDGRALPFPDGAFDVVAAMDVLEHVPKNERPAFLREMLRVSARLVLVSGPRRDEAVAEAERSLSDEIEKRYHVRHVQLAEHEEHGLISDSETRVALESGGAAVLSLGFGSLASWVRAQKIRSRYLLRKKTPQVLEKLDAYLESGDLRPEFEPPFYRMFWLASKSVSRENLEDLAETIRDRLLGAWEAAQKEHEERFREFAAASAALESEAFLSALVVARGDAEAMRRCLSSVLTQKVDFDLEVAVWSRGGLLRFATEAARDFPQVRILDAESLAVAAEQLRGDAILLVDEAAAPAPDAAARLQAQRDRDPDPGVWAWRGPWKRFFTWSRTGGKWNRAAAGKLPALRTGRDILAKPRRGWIYGRCLLVTREMLAVRSAGGRSAASKDVFLWA